MPEGVVVAEWAARLLAVAGELDTGLAAFRGDHQMRLRVSASLTIAEQLLPGWLVCLQAAAQQSGRPTPQILLTAANSLSELTVAEDIAARRLTRVPVRGVDLRRSLRAIWAGGSLPPAGAARDLLAHVTAGQLVTTR